MVTASDIRKARESTGESQTAFAIRFGVDQATISRWEKEGPPDRGPVLMTVERILSEIQAGAAV